MFIKPNLKQSLMEKLGIYWFIALAILYFLLVFFKIISSAIYYTSDKSPLFKVFNSIFYLTLSLIAFFYGSLYIFLNYKVTMKNIIKSGKSN